MDPQGWALLVWAGGSLAFLVGLETWCAVSGRPTISERIRRLGTIAPIVVIWSSFVAGYLLAHFFDSFIPH